MNLLTTRIKPVTMPTMCGGCFMYQVDAKDALCDVCRQKPEHLRATERRQFIAGMTMLFVLAIAVVVIAFVFAMVRGV